MSSTPLIISAWSAWIPGIHTPEEWQQWALGNKQTQSDERPSVAEIPPMLRRRLSSLGKMALSATFPLYDNADHKIPCVFSSRHGELERTVGLLQTLAKHEPLSPTHFSLSVHNAIGGVMSIARKDPSSITALSGDVGSTLLEASAIMAEQSSDEILCIIYDEPVPEIYAEDDLGPAEPYAAAFLLSSSDSSKPPHNTSCSLTLSICDASPTAVSSDEPQTLAFLRYLLTPNRSELILSGDRHGWRWTKDESDTNLAQ